MSIDEGAGISIILQHNVTVFVCGYHGVHIVERSSQFIDNFDSVPGYYTNHQNALVDILG
jgi:hypothetical protein